MSLQRPAWRDSEMHRFKLSSRRPTPTKSLPSQTPNVVDALTRAMSQISVATRTLYVTAAMRSGTSSQLVQRAKRSKTGLRTTKERKSTQSQPYLRTCLTLNCPMAASLCTTNMQGRKAKLWWNNKLQKPTMTNLTTYYILLHFTFTLSFIDVKSF